jgi:hypothetical protein
VINSTVTPRAEGGRLEVPADLAVGTAGEVLWETNAVRNQVERRLHTVARITVGTDVNKKHRLVG